MQKELPDHITSSAFLPPHELPTGVLVWWVGVMARNPDRLSTQNEYARLKAELDSRFTSLMDVPLKKKYL